MKGLSLYVANHLAAEAASHFYDLKDVKDNSKPEHKNIITLAKIPEPRYENYSSPGHSTNPANRGRKEKPFNMPGQPQTISHFNQQRKGP